MNSRPPPPLDYPPFVSVSAVPPPTIPVKSTAVVLLGVPYLPNVEGLLRIRGDNAPHFSGIKQRLVPLLRCNRYLFVAVGSGSGCCGGVGDASPEVEVCDNTSGDRDRVFIVFGEVISHARYPAG